MKSRGYELREVLDFIASSALAGGDANLFLPHVNNLLYDDPFLVLTDYQARVSALWLDPVAWAPQSILKLVRMDKIYLGSLDPRLRRTKLERKADAGDAAIVAHGQRRLRKLSSKKKSGARANGRRFHFSISNSTASRYQAFTRW